ncbi:MAG: hypothetical protein IJ146_04640, partial [Kiritimatiellae bacterium]|nr:hypothetical protein [Kiritimatiellia bacterium]
MEIVQINPMGACIAGIAAIGAFALVCFVWRHRIRNAAVAVLAAALALVAIPKNDRQAIGRASSPLSAAMPRDGSVETPHVSAINVSTSGVDLVLFRPAADSISAVEVTVAAKTNLAEHAAWFAVTNATFLTGDTNVFVSIARETLDGFGVTSPAFFSFGGSGDTDGDGLLDWNESLNFGTSPYLVDTDGDGMPDDWELAHGLDPLHLGEAGLDPDEDGLSNLEEFRAGTDPNSGDTDNDGLGDRAEAGWYETSMAYSLPSVIYGVSTYICSAPVGTVYSGAYPFTLPFPVRANFGEVGFDPATGEWSGGGATNFPACYKAWATPMVQARFSIEPKISTNVVVFAQMTGNVFGVYGLLDKPVDFVDGASAWVSFPSIGVVYGQVARNTVNMGWFVSRLGGEAIAPTLHCMTGPHRIYVVLGDPVEPWSSDLTSDQCAWTNALEWACGAAVGAMDFPAAASNVRVAINRSGSFFYDTVDGASYFTNDYRRWIFWQVYEVELSECIKILNDPLMTKKVNCTDCASFVFSFSNLLGCNLYASIMGWYFDTNPYCAIGQPDWTPPDWGWGFSYHEVAWEG